MTGDTCPTCGQPMPGAARDDDCLCGDGIVLHRYGNSEEATKGERGACSRISCKCDGYRPLEVPSGRT